jgi:hypothetical protein
MYRMGRKQQMKSLSDNKIRNKLAKSTENIYLCTGKTSVDRASALSTAIHFECQPTSDKDWKVTTCVGIKK